MHVIPWKLLRQGLGALDAQAQAGPPAGKMIRLLLEAALANQIFDEGSYLKANPDVADAVRRGKLRSGRAHYLATGYFEGRDTGYAEFDEAWYLQRYPDVQKAVQRGLSASGLEHFKGPGMSEWRSPNKDAEADIARWRAVIAPQRPAAKPAAASARAPAAAAEAAPPAGQAKPDANRRRPAAAA